MSKHQVISGFLERHSTIAKHSLIALALMPLLVVPAAAQQAPVIAQLVPAFLPAGTPGVSVIVDGSGFTAATAVRWTAGGVVTNLSGVTFVSSTRVNVPIPAALLAAPGTALVAVVNPGGTPSQPLRFTISNTLSITSVNIVNPPPAGSPTTGIGIFGTGFAAGATVRWTGRFRSQTFPGFVVASPTQINGGIPVSLLGVADSVQLVVVNPDGEVSNPYYLSVFTAPGAVLTSISPENLPAGSGNTTLTLDGTFFPQNPTIRWTANNQTTLLQDVRVVSPTRVTATIPASLLATPGTANVSVYTSSTYPSERYTFTIAPPVPVAATVTVSRPSNPTDQPAVTVTIPMAQSGPLQGTLNLSFAPDTSVTGLPAGYVDPAVKFAGSSGLTLNFTIPANATTATLPGNGQFSQGTVAGTFTVTASSLTTNGLSVLPARAPSATLQQLPAAPVISPGSVKIVNITGTQFGVEVQGVTNTRSLTTATLTFNAASGTQLSGSSVSVPIGAGPLSSWFDSAAGRQNGGAFLMTIPFNFSGNTSALNSVSVTLANSAGTSAAVSGTR
jgi:hypothetical protein